MTLNQKFAIGVQLSDAVRGEGTIEIIEAQSDLGFSESLLKPNAIMCGLCYERRLPQEVAGVYTLARTEGACDCKLLDRADAWFLEPGNAPNSFADLVPREVGASRTPTLDTIVSLSDVYLTRERRRKLGVTSVRAVDSVSSLLPWLINRGTGSDGEPFFLIGSKASNLNSIIFNVERDSGVPSDRHIFYGSAANPHFQATNKIHLRGDVVVHLPDVDETSKALDHLNQHTSRSEDLTLTIYALGHMTRSGHKREIQVPSLRYFAWDY